MEWRGSGERGVREVRGEWGETRIVNKWRVKKMEKKATMVRGERRVKEMERHEDTEKGREWRKNNNSEGGERGSIRLRDDAKFWKQNQPKSLIIR